MVQLLSDLRDRYRLGIAQLKLEAPFFTRSPRFHVTQLTLVVLGLGALAVGRVGFINTGQQTFSLTLSIIPLLASLVLILINDSVVRLRLFAYQALAILLFALLGLVLAVTYYLTISIPDLLPSIRVSWLGASLLLAYLAMRTLVLGFIRLPMNTETYPGMRTAPLLFCLFVLNAVWWFWSSLMQFLI